MNSFPHSYLLFPLKLSTLLFRKSQRSQVSPSDPPPTGLLVSAGLTTGGWNLYALEATDPNLC